MDEPIENEDIRLARLEAENLRLRAELEARKVAQKGSEKVGKLVAGGTTRLLVGKGLKTSVRQLLDELPGGNVSKDTISEIITHVIWRLTRIGTFALLVATAPILVMVIQTFMLGRQNDKLERQNELISRQNQRLDQQINLEEGNRRSSLIFFMSNIMDRMDAELGRHPEHRTLSESLIGRIVSLSQALRPYRYLENDTLTPRQLSPERGQLLFSLVNSNLHKDTYDKIFASANFDYADLREANFSGAYMRGAQLTHSTFSKANFQNADLQNADLSEAWLEEATFRNTAMNGVNLSGANLRGGRMVKVSLQNGDLSKADLRGIYLHGDFTNSNLDGIRIDSATLVDVILDGCYFQSPKWVDSLKFSQNLKGLRFVVDIYEVKEELKKEGFATDTVYVLRPDPKSKLAQMRVCDQVVEAVVESAPRVRQVKKQSLASGLELSIYLDRNPFGMEELGIEQDSIWRYRLSADEQDLASTVMWVQFDPARGKLWELFPEEGKQPAALSFDQRWLRSLGK
ncbi:MAG: pentapeptide repeat-containing protein, partial [Bacteroidota bacterium]